MPASPAVSPNFLIPRMADDLEVAFGAQINSIVDRIDAYLNARVAQPGDLIVSVAATRTGCLLCNGDQSQNASDYPALASVIGSGSSGVYGSAATGKLYLPDFRGKVIIGAGQDTGRGLTARALGQYGGAETVAADLAPHSHGVNDPSHAHTIYDPGHGHGVSDPSHQHGVAFANSFEVAAGTAWHTVGTGTFVTQAATTGISINGAGTGIGIYGAYTGISIQNAGAGGGHNNVQPYGVANVFIKT